MGKTINNLNKSIETSLELSKYSKTDHTHSYLPLSGGTMTGVITTPNSAQGIKIGDDAVICDRDIANHMVIEGVTTPTMGGITFGSDKDTNIYRGGANILKTDDAFNCVGGYYWNGESLDTRYAAKSHGTHLTLGTTSSTAYRGDYGNTAYTHSQAAHAPSNAQKNSDITKAEIEAKLTGTITSHNHSGTYAAASHGTHLTIGTGSGNAAAGNHTHTHLELKGTNTVTSTTNDTTANWGAQKTSIHWYTTTGQLTNQPSQWGYLLNIGKDSEVHQLWMTQASGDLLHRGGNASGWSGTWRTVLDTSNFKTHVTPSAIGAATSSSVGTLSSLQTSAKGNLVAAINELFQNANNGKQLIASAIGSPLSSSDTFSAMSTKITTMNTNLKNFLVQCGAKIESGKEGLNDLISLLISDSIMVKFPISFSLNSLPISCGQYHAAVLKNTGTIATVGYNYSGQLGIGNTTNKAVFTTPSTSVIGVVQVECGGSHTVVLKRDGSVMVTGENSSGQLGLNTQDDALSFTGMLNVNNDVIKVACGTNHTLVLKSDGVVWGTGSNSSGQLGVGTNTNAKTLTKSPLTNVIDIIAGGSHSFAIDKNGDVWCTGLNGNGQLGMGNYTNYSSFVKVTSLSNVKQIACGTNHTLVLKNDGTVWATGYNYYGQLGLGTSGSTANRNEFVKVSISSVSHIACGAYHSVLVKTDGTIWATGNNDDGQLGLGNTTGKTTFTQVTTNVSNAAHVFCGANFTYYMRKDGTVWTCGGNDKGQIAIGTTTKNLTFVGLSSSLLG